ncbi:MAG: LysR family transcriptional regulator [Alphaproteobacteria bacterium]|nr:LysR family transcriptional regulator [Alphaproteobacteria bacterium]
MNWEDIKIFLALMRHGTVRAAAAKLKISHSTVARRIDALEHKLAVRLFDRLPSGYVLTLVGEDMLQVAEQIEEEMGGLERRIIGHDHKLSGSIKISLVDALATHLLMPYIVIFTEKYPDIQLELQTTYSAVNLDIREADIALRFTSAPPDHLIGRRLLTCSIAPYASKNYLATHSLEPKFEPPAHWIGFGPQGAFPNWVKKSEFPHIAAKGQIVNLLVQLEACKAGMGISMLPCFLGAGEESLTRLSDPKPDPRFKLWLLTHRELRTNTRIRVFSDFIIAAIKSERHLLTGQT